MNFGFKAIAPLVTSRLLEDTGSEEIISFSLLLDKNTGKVSQQIENEKGKSAYTGKIDTGKMFTGFPGSLIKKKIEQGCPEAESIFLKMDYKEKALIIAYLDNEARIIKTNTYE